VLTGSPAGPSVDALTSEKSVNSPRRLNAFLKNDDTLSAALDRNEDGPGARDPGGV
jgi:hypothetical protein